MKKALLLIVLSVMTTGTALAGNVRTRSLGEVMAVTINTSDGQRAHYILRKKQVAAAFIVPQKSEDQRMPQYAVVRVLLVGDDNKAIDLGLVTMAEATKLMEQFEEVLARGSR